MPSDETISNPLNPRRRRISAGSFRAGQSVIGVVQNQFVLNTKIIKSLSVVGDRVDNNTRKISIIKNILGYQKSDLKENLASINPQVVMLRNLDEILKTLRDEKKVEEKNKVNERKKRENEKRRLQETRLEQRFKKLKETTQKILAPVKGILDKIIGGFIAIVGGKFLAKLVDYLGDPKNQEKIGAVTRFFSDFGPKLLTGYLLFGTRLGRTIGRLTGFLIRGAVRLGAASLLLLKKLGIKGAGGLARGLLGGRGRALVGALQIGTAAAGFFGLNNFLFGNNNDDETQGFSGGGLVDGPYGSDQVNARLTDGEFVLSAPAVAAIGPSVLESVNEKYGGSNEPRVIRNTIMAQEGGLIGGVSQSIRNRMNRGALNPFGQTAVRSGAAGRERVPVYSGRPYQGPRGFGPTTYGTVDPFTGASYTNPGGLKGMPGTGGNPFSGVKINPRGTLDSGTLPQRYIDKYGSRSVLGQRQVKLGRKAAARTFGRGPTQPLPMGRSMPKGGGLGAAVIGQVLSMALKPLAEEAGKQLAKGLITLTGEQDRFPQVFDKQGPTLGVDTLRSIRAREMAIPGPPGSGMDSPQIIVMDDNNTVNVGGESGQTINVIQPRRIAPSSDKMTTLGL